MIQKLAILTLNILCASFCVAAGHITNTQFNEMIEKTTVEQKKTASDVGQMAKTEAAIQNYLIDRPQNRSLSGSY